MRWLARIAGALIALPLLYAAAAIAGALIPANIGRAAPAEGVRIYVADNGIHTDLIVPAAGWGDIVRPGDIADPRFAGQRYLAFGWGDRDFYLNTPSWDRLSPGRAISALAGGGPTVLHVAHVGEPATGPKIRALLLRPEEYRRLTGFIRATFLGNHPASVHGYGNYDAFYEAQGHYSALNTCNQWTGQALRTAGVRMGLWTPLPISVMLWL